MKKGEIRFHPASTKSGRSPKFTCDKHIRQFIVPLLLLVKGLGCINPAARCSLAVSAQPQSAGVAGVVAILACNQAPMNCALSTKVWWCEITPFTSLLEFPALPAAVVP